MAGASRSCERGWIEVAFAASIGAAAVHFAAAHSHLEEWAPAGAFMLLCGFAQLAWAFLVLHVPSDRVQLAGVVGNAGVVALWLVSRTLGVPFGPHAGAVEDIHAADAVATTLEIIVVVALFAAGGRLSPPRAVRGATWLLAVFGIWANAHEPSREQLTAAAALLMAVAARNVVVLLPSIGLARRRNVTPSFIRRDAVRLRAAVRAVVGAGGTVR